MNSHTVVSSVSAEPDATWTKVGKGGRAVAFPPDAASAFSSSRRGGRAERDDRPSRAEFPSDAAAAFGKKTSRPPTVARDSRAEFDHAAASAFGSHRETRRDSDRGRPSEFDAAAAAAFGGGSRRREGDSRKEGDGGFPSAFGKKKSVFGMAADIGFAEGGDSGSYGMSALARKRAEVARAKAEAPKSYDEMFPVLGAPAAAPAAASAKPAMRSFADIMRERAAAEAEEEERRAAEMAEDAKLRHYDEMERARLRRLHAARYAYSNSNYVTSEEDSAMEVAYAPGNDLEYDAYGASYSGPDRPVPTVEESSTDEEETADDDAY